MTNIFPQNHLLAHITVLYFLNSCLNKSNNLKSYLLTYYSIYFPTQKCASVYSSI